MFKDGDIVFTQGVDILRQPGVDILRNPVDDNTGDISSDPLDVHRGGQRRPAA